MNHVDCCIHANLRTPSGYGVVWLTRSNVNVNGYVALNIESKSVSLNSFTGCQCGNSDQSDSPLGKTGLRAEAPERVRGNRTRPSISGSSKENGRCLRRKMRVAMARPEATLSFPSRPPHGKPNPASIGFTQSRLARSRLYPSDRLFTGQSKEESTPPRNAPRSTVIAPESP